MYGLNPPIQESTDMASTVRAKSNRVRADRKGKPRDESAEDRQAQALRNIQDQLLEIAARLAFIAVTAGAAVDRK
ncbi:MAG TPA: hypothetical protein VGB04_05005 [Allosphingosinicella sp.]|jgi:hypothetical protein